MFKQTYYEKHHVNDFISKPKCISNAEWHSYAPLHTFYKKHEQPNKCQCKSSRKIISMLIVNHNLNFSSTAFLNQHFHLELHPLISSDIISFRVLTRNTTGRWSAARPTRSVMTSCEVNQRFHPHRTNQILVGVRRRLCTGTG